MAPLILLGIRTRFWRFTVPFLQQRITRIRRPRALRSQMVVPSEKPLFIQLDIPNSPLLLSLSPDAKALLGTSAPTAPSRSTLSPDMIPLPEMTLSDSSSSSSSLTFQPSHYVPAITITCSPPQTSRNGCPTSPPPSVSPHSRSRLSASASRKLVEFIDFLEKIDRDMTTEIEHVKESIREAREYVGEWQQERSARQAELSKRREYEKRETEEPDSDFWPGI